MLDETAGPNAFDLFHHHPRKSKSGSRTISTTKPKSVADGSSHNGRSSTASASINYGCRDCRCHTHTIQPSHCSSCGPPQQPLREKEDEDDDDDEELPSSESLNRLGWILVMVLAIVGLGASLGLSYLFYGFMNMSYCVAIFWNFMNLLIWAVTLPKQCSKWPIWCSMGLIFPFAVTSGSLVRYSNYSSNVIQDKSGQYKHWAMFTFASYVAGTLTYWVLRQARLAIQYTITRQEEEEEEKEQQMMKIHQDRFVLTSPTAAAAAAAVVSCPYCQTQILVRNQQKGGSILLSASPAYAPLPIRENVGTTTSTYFEEDNDIYIPPIMDHSMLDDSEEANEIFIPPMTMDHAILGPSEEVNEIYVPSSMDRPPMRRHSDKNRIKIETKSKHIDNQQRLEDRVDLALRRVAVEIVASLLKGGLMPMFFLAVLAMQASIGAYQDLLEYSRHNPYCSNPGADGLIESPLACNMMQQAFSDIPVFDDTRHYYSMDEAEQIASLVSNEDKINLERLEDHPYNLLGTSDTTSTRYLTVHDYARLQAFKDANEHVKLLYTALLAGISWFFALLSTHIFKRLTKVSLWRFLRGAVTIWECAAVFVNLGLVALNLVFAAVDSQTLGSNNVLIQGIEMILFTVDVVCLLGICYTALSSSSSSASKGKSMDVPSSKDSSNSTNGSITEKKAQVPQGVPETELDQTARSYTMNDSFYSS